jgi:hypothetical protein
VFGKWRSIACCLYRKFEGYRAQRALQSMPDHILRDMGISRSDLLDMGAWERAERERNERTHRRG